VIYRCLYDIKRSTPDNFAVSILVSVTCSGNEGVPQIMQPPWLGFVGSLAHPQLPQPIQRGGPT
jgi:hypothetical protein